MASNDVTPAQRFAFYKMRLTEVLTQHNPAGLNTIGGLLQKFPGKEHQVYIQICKKCGVQPCNPPTIDDFDGQGNPRPAQTSATSDEVTNWLKQHGFDRAAGQHAFKFYSMEDFKKISKGKLIELGVMPKSASQILAALANQDQPSQPSVPEQPPAERKSPGDFEVGENCFTKMVSTSGGKDRWLNARVTRVNEDNTYDIFVYNSKAHGVPPEAVNVPRIMLKKGTEKVQVAVPPDSNKQAENRAAKRPQFQQGDRVRVFGLRSHTSYNGLCGTVLLYVPSERRYQVRLDTNDVIAIKQRNVAPENGEAPNSAAKDEASKKKKGGKKVKDDGQLSELMIKLMQDNPDADPQKLGEFAAGYLLAKQKLDDS